MSPPVARQIRFRRAGGRAPPSAATGLLAVYKLSGKASTECNKNHIPRPFPIAAFAPDSHRDGIASRFGHGRNTEGIRTEHQWNTRALLCSTGVPLVFHVGSPCRTR